MAAPSSGSELPPVKASAPPPGGWDEAAPPPTPAELLGAMEDDAPPPPWLELVVPWPALVVVAPEVVVAIEVYVDFEMVVVVSSPPQPVTQNTLYLVSAPCEPSAWTVSFTWTPCRGWGVMPLRSSV